MFVWIRLQLTFWTTPVLLRHPLHESIVCTRSKANFQRKDTILHWRCECKKIASCRSVVGGKSSSSSLKAGCGDNGSRQSLEGGEVAARCEEGPLAPIGAQAQTRLCRHRAEWPILAAAGTRLHDRLFTWCQQTQPCPSLNFFSYSSGVFPETRTVRQRVMGLRWLLLSHSHTFHLLKPKTKPFARNNFISGVGDIPAITGKEGFVCTIGGEGYIQGRSVKPRTSIAVFKNARSFFIILKRNKLTIWFDTYTKYFCRQWRKIKEVFKRLRWLVGSHSARRKQRTYSVVGMLLLHNYRQNFSKNQTIFASHQKYC